MPKLLILRDASGGEIASNPKTWARLSVSTTTGVDRKPRELTLIRYLDGSQDKVVDSLSDLVKLADKIGD